MDTDFQKLRRATAMITLSVVRESILWIFNLLFERQLQGLQTKVKAFRVYVPLAA